MTENVYSLSEPTAAELADRATWAVNSLLEAGEDALAADLAASYESELRHLPTRRPRLLRKAS